MVVLGGGAVSDERGTPVGGGQFLMSEVPLYAASVRSQVGA